MQQPPGNELIVFVDLEDTVINEWMPVYKDMHLLDEKVAKLRRFLSLNNVDGISIFSFACYSHRDVPIFDRSLRAWLARDLGLDPQAISVTDVKAFTDELLDEFGFDFIEVSEYLDKFRTFVEFAQHRYRERTVVLIDDAVPNTELNYHDQLLRIVTLNVDTPNWEETKLK